MNAEYAYEFVTGMQNGEDPNHLKVSSCCKHYGGWTEEAIIWTTPLIRHTLSTDAYSLELWNGVDRHHFNAIVTPQDFQDTCLPTFEVC